MDEPSVLDVAIIGGGVAGCYCGYRLLADPAASPGPVLGDALSASGRDRPSIALYECSDRIGGRLWSYRFPNLPGQPAEMGGMCFSPLHANVFGLCTEGALGLETAPGNEFMVNNLQYLRRHRFAYGDFQPAAGQGNEQADYYPNVVPYFLPDKERWQYPLDVLISAFNEAVPGSKHWLDVLKKLPPGDNGPAFAAISQLDTLLRSAQVAGTDTPLYDTGFWNLLSEHSSGEVYEMATMSTGWYSATANWNGYNTMLGCFIDFCVAQEWTKLKNGYDTLPIEMAKRFSDRGGRIHTETRLYGLEVDADSAEPLIVMRLGSPGAPVYWTQRARYVILALPQRSIDLLDGDSFLFRNEQFVRDLSTVTCEPTGKLFMTFAEPWWQRVPMPPGQTATTIKDGQSATDLPLRLCYYLGSDANGSSLLLASCSDSIATDYWDGYLADNRFGRSDRASGETFGVRSLLHDAPPAMLDDAVQQLEEIHGCTVPAPFSAAYVNWSEDPYGGGFHFWNSHVCSWQVMPRIRRPVPGVNVFLCGEAFSAKQGWVEGALNTAERTLETYFGLNRPTWVPPTYDFGP